MIPDLILIFFVIVGVISFVGYEAGGPNFGRFNVQILLAGSLPLVILSIYLMIEYQKWNWNIFPYGSFVPHFLAFSCFLVTGSVILVRLKTKLLTKLIYALSSLLGWLVLWSLTTLFTCCSMGDCI